jgi:hypothetical protein
VDNLQIPPNDDPAEQEEVRRHAWWPHQDMANEVTIWRCTCKEQVFQPFGAALPDDLIGHPQSFGQMRGE